MAYDVFISYSRKDTAIADEICKVFDSVGITYFIDRQGIGGGFEFPEVLANAILDSKIILYLASENSYKSKFTNSELTFAFNEKPKNSILPYIIDGSNMPPALRFVFSSINWRTKETHPIETVLLKDILLLLGKSSVKTEIGASKVVEKECVHNGHEYVDLGLPSGLKWATCNIGANKPEEYGDYFAWGETTTKSSYIPSNSKTHKVNMGDISGNPNYDVARATWRCSWRLPTSEEFEELIQCCTWTWIDENGQKGYKVTSKRNGNSIFLPAAGYRDGSSLLGAGSSDHDSFYHDSLGHYWSSSPEDSTHAYFLFSVSRLGSLGSNVGYGLRYYGNSVRAVCE